MDRDRAVWVPKNAKGEGVIVDFQVEYHEGNAESDKSRYSFQWRPEKPKATKKRAFWFAEEQDHEKQIDVDRVYSQDDDEMKQVIAELTQQIQALQKEVRELKSKKEYQQLPPDTRRYRKKTGQGVYQIELRIDPDARPAKRPSNAEPAQNAGSAFWRNWKYESPEKEYIQLEELKKAKGKSPAPQRKPAREGSRSGNREYDAES